MGLGAGGHGVGKFNAGKLNVYLHGLNRRLQEENESMTRMNGVLQEEVMTLKEEVEMLQGQARLGGGRRISVGRRVSDIGTTLGHVAEDVSGEGWMEEKAAMEEELEGLRAEVENCTQDRDDAVQRLQKEQAERTKDKERWKERMDEVERGVTEIVGNLESKLEAAVEKANAAEKSGEKIKELSKALEESEAERQFANQRAEKAESLLENGKGLGNELGETNERLGKLMGQLREAQARAKDLEEEVLLSNKRVDVLEWNAREDRERIRKLQEELDDKEVNLSTAERQVSAKEAALEKAENELHAAQSYIASLEGDLAIAEAGIQALENELTSAGEQLRNATEAEDQAQDAMTRLEEEAERNAELARQMEEALEAAGAEMAGDQEAIAELRNKVATLEREYEREQTRSRIEPSTNIDSALEEAAGQIQVLEGELDDAHREIGRLKAQLSQSPARKAISHARESRIEMLEKERDELLDRAKTMKSAMIGMNTPSKVASTSGISPFHRQVLDMTMKTPKTPGGPLRELSWLHRTISDQSASPYVAEIARLQKELDRANEDIDEKLDRLEDAGFGVVELTQQLEDERARNTNLEEDIAHLRRREERRLRRLEKARCLKCRSKVDLRGFHRAAEGDESSMEFASLGLITDPPAPPAKTSEALRIELTTVHQQLKSMKEHWEQEKRKLLGDNAILQDATRRLNLQMQQAKAKPGIQGDLDQANRIISDLEEALKAERMRLRTLTTEQQRVDREKADVVLQLQRTESDMEDVKRHMQRIKKDNNELEAELRSNANADQKARLIEAKAAENLETIEQLRQERSLLAADHKSLQRRFTKISEHLKKLRDDHATSQNSHANRRQELDLHLLEIEDLKRQLADALQANEVAQIQSGPSQDKETEERKYEQEIAALEADLARVRRSCEAIGRDLRAERGKREEEKKVAKVRSSEAKRELEEARREVQKVERVRKQVGAELRVLRERVALLEAERQGWEGHVCAMSDSQLDALRAQYKQEAKGLVVQIHYLKAKWTRENMLREDLGNQKKYLLVLLARHERGDEKILAAIAQIGFPVAESAPRPRRKPLKSVAMSVVFLLRARRYSEKWRGERAPRPLLQAALEDVRRRRVQPGPSKTRTS